MFQVKVVRASVGPAGIPLFTLCVTYPRFIHAEIMTHRDRGRNAASSRAIPWKRKGKKKKLAKDLSPREACDVSMMQSIGVYENTEVDYFVENCMFSMVMTDPVIPMYMGIEKPGMQAGEELQGADRQRAEQIILKMRDQCVAGVEELASLGLHKSICNRYVEPWMWITVLMTATEWNNFYRLRCHSAAERHFNHIANMMREEMRNTKPTPLKEGQWHLPYFDLPDAIELARRGLSNMDPLLAPKISAGRSARLSYLTHEGIRDISEDIRLANQLIDPPTAGLDEEVMHASPLEHPCEAMADPSFRSGPFRGWRTLRSLYPKENIPGWNPEYGKQTC